MKDIVDFQAFGSVQWRQFRFPGTIRITKVDPVVADHGIQVAYRRFEYKPTDGGPLQVGHFVMDFRNGYMPENYLSYADGRKYVRDFEMSEELSRANSYLHPFTRSTTVKTAQKYIGYWANIAFGDFPTSSTGEPRISVNGDVVTSIFPLSYFEDEENDVPLIGQLVTTWDSDRQALLSAIRHAPDGREIARLSPTDIVEFHIEASLPVTDTAAARISREHLHVHWHRKADKQWRDSSFESCVDIVSAAETSVIDDQLARWEAVREFKYIEDSDGRIRTGHFHVQASGEKVAVWKEWWIDEDGARRETNVLEESEIEQQVADSDRFRKKGDTLQETSVRIASKCLAEFSFPSHMRVTSYGAAELTVGDGEVSVRKPVRYWNKGENIPRLGSFETITDAVSLETRVGFVDCEGRPVGRIARSTVDKIVAAHRRADHHEKTGEMKP